MTSRGHFAELLLTVPRLYSGSPDSPVRVAGGAVSRHWQRSVLESGHEPDVGSLRSGD